MKAARVVALLLMVLLVACGGSGGDAASSGSEAAGGGAAEGGTQLSRDSAEEAPIAAEGVAGEAAAVDAEGDGDAAVEPPDIEPLPDPPAVRPGDRVIKEGTISVEVAKGEFDSSFRAVIETARRYGGDVAASSTTTADNGDIFGSVTVRVPVENFEDLVVGLGNIGTVVNRDVSSQDVSAEYTDLESRLRHLQAQERFYLGLFDQAETVEDAIRVQQQLDGIQAAIEKIKGRMNYLDDRTSYSTLSVELFEPGAGAPLLETEEPATDRPTFARYWDTARDAFVNVVGAMFVVFVFLAPLLVPAVIVGALWMSSRRRRQPEPPAPAARLEEPDTVGADR